MIMEKLVEWRLAGETEVLGENPPQLHFVHHKSHLTRPGIESGAPWWEASDSAPVCIMIITLRTIPSACSSCSCGSWPWSTSFLDLQVYIWIDCGRMSICVRMCPSIVYRFHMPVLTWEESRYSERSISPHATTWRETSKGQVTSQTPAEFCCSEGWETDNIITWMRW
jgi:hypothetical protein